MHKVKEKRIVSLKYNAIINAIRQIVSLIAPLIVLPYLSRAIGVNRYGVINFANVEYFIWLPSSLLLCWIFRFIIGLVHNSAEEQERMRCRNN